MSPLWILLTILPILGGAERFKCKGRILGAYYADVKSGCKAFHVCVRVAGGGVRDFRFFCPPGTLFHQEAQTCTDWGSDDPLACPNVDGQFDIYKIKSEYESKKLPSFNKGEDESVYGLQRAETGDRRLQQQNNNVNRASPNPASKASNDLRTAHSQDFFSGRRDDREETVVHPVQAVSRRPKQSQRESYRRATTRLPNATPSFSETTIPNKPDPIPQPAHKPQYETNQHKSINLLRRRPVIASTTSPLKALHKPLYQKNVLIQRPNLPPQFKDFEEEYVEVSRVIPKPYSKPQVKPGQPIPESDLLAKQKMPQMPQFLTQNRQVPLKNPQHKPNRYYPSNPTPLPSSHKSPTTTTVRLPPSHPTPVYYSTTIGDYGNGNGIIEVFNYDDQPKRQENKNEFNYIKQNEKDLLKRVKQIQFNSNDYNQNEFNQNDFKQNETDLLKHVKQIQFNSNDYNQNEFNQNDFKQNETDLLKRVKQIQFNSNDYNQNEFNQNDFKPYKNEFKENDYSQNQFVDDDFKTVDRKQNNNLQSNVKKNENVPLKVKNTFSVEEIVEDGARTRELNNFNRNYNKGTTESEVNKINAYNKFRQSITSNNSPVTISTPPENDATVPTKSKINSVAITTNNGFLFDGSLGQDEDDGQYHPPSDEDDGQYRPEHYDTELLSGAHSINIAASGNKILEDKKSNTKNHSELKKKSPSPRPFRVQPQASVNEKTESPYSSLPIQTPRTFDVYKTYTTTSRPRDFPDPEPVVKHKPTSPPATVASTAAFTAAPRTFETRPPQTQFHAPTFPPNPPSRPTTRNPISKPVNKTEDTSYDYAYYDSDSGFPEYEQLADFGTKTIQK